VALRGRECKSKSQHKTALSLTDIQCVNNTASDYPDNSTDVSGSSIRCCGKFKFEIPSTLLINLMALIVLISMLVIYAGLPILINDLIKTAKILATAT
jgi:hypothetical protein